MLLYCWLINILVNITPKLGLVAEYLRVTWCFLYYGSSKVRSLALIQLTQRIDWLANKENCALSLTNKRKKNRNLIGQFYAQSSPISLGLNQSMRWVNWIHASERTLPLLIKFCHITYILLVNVRLCTCNKLLAVDSHPVSITAISLIEKVIVIWIQPSIEMLNQQTLRSLSSRCSSYEPLNQY